MHVAPPDLRALRQRGLVIRFAMLGPIAFVLAEVPEGGTVETCMEQPSRLPHWALVLDGELTVERDGPPLRVSAGHALYVPGDGSDHHFHATGGARIAAFQPTDPSADLGESGLAGLGFEILTPGASDGAAPIIVPALRAGAPRAGTIEARSWSMPPYAMTTARFGSSSGYTAAWCDAPHWGLVTAGQLVIEYEDDVEMVAAGDAYYCPAGAPAHRLQAADPATIVDLTPIEALAGDGRVAEWRRAAFARADASAQRPVSVVALG